MRSLQGRLLWGFVGCTVLLWIGLVGWGVYTMFTDGKRYAVFEMTRYAQQILVIAQAYEGVVQKLGPALAAIEALENTRLAGDEPADADHRVSLQLWIHGQPLVPYTPLPDEPNTEALPLPEKTLQQLNTEPLTDGFSELVVGDDTWWAVVARDLEKGITVRVADSATIRGSLGYKQWIFFFLPLVFSLPLLLLPAWFMTRRGLQPLRDLAQAVTGSGQSGGLHTLALTQYRELNPLVVANNQLMQRLGVQLAKERTFVANIAHEMKTPLAIVQANAERLAEQAQGAGEVALQDLLAGITRSDHLIQQLLRLARLEQDPDAQAAPRHMDLAEFVRQRVAQAEPLAVARRLKLAVQAPEQLELALDADAFSAVLDNLLDNAIKYSEAQGTIWIRLAKVADAVQLVVEDTGHGIEEAKLEHAFERFTRLGDWQAQTQVAGAGLGLSIVRQAAARLGGKLQLRNRTEMPGLHAQLEFPAAQ